MKLFKIIIVIYFLFFSFSLGKDIIDIAVEKALNNDYKLRSLYYQERAKEYKIEQSRAGYRPQVILSSYLGWQRYKPYYGDETDQTLKYFYLALKQPIYKPSVFVEIRQSRYYKDLTTLQRFQEDQYMRHLFFSTFLDYLYYKEKISLLKLLSKLYFSKYLYLKELFKLRRITKNQYLTSKSDYENSLADLKDAEIEFLTRRKALALILGDQNFVNKLDKFSLNIQPMLKKEELEYKFWKKDLFKNFEIKQAKINVKIAREEINLRKYRNYPTVDLELSYRYSSTSAVSVASDDKRIALVIDFPIYQGGYVKSSVLEAKELLKASLMDLKNIEFEKEQELKDYWSQLNKSYQKLGLLKKRLKTEKDTLNFILFGKNKKVFTKIDVINQKIRFLNVNLLILDEIHNLSLSYANLLYLISQYNNYKKLNIFIKK